MDISNINTDRLKQILKEKRKEVEDFYLSEEYISLKKDEKIEIEYYRSLNKFKSYFYKKKYVDIYLDSLYNEINLIEKELEMRNITIDKLVKKRFDNQPIL